MSRVLVLQAHPDSQSYGAHLGDAYADGARRSGAEVQTLSLASLSFDPILRGGFRGEQPLEPDLQAAREQIEWADHLAIQFPVWWGHWPALLKGFIDRVMLPGWAFRNTGRALPDGLLAGKTARILATMDSPWWWYWLAHGRAAHRSLVHATLHYCGVKPVRSTTVYALRTLDAAARDRWVGRVGAIGASDVRRLG